MMTAAVRPELAGPNLLAGSPLSYWVPDDDVRARPFDRRSIIGDDGVLAAYGIERLGDGLSPDVETRAPHPLDLPNPNRHAGQFGGVGVDLNPEQRFRPDRREGTRKTEQLALDDNPTLDVLQLDEREIQEVPGAAGWVQDTEGAQPRHEAVIRRLPCNPLA